MRFAIKISSVMKPVMFVAGVNHENSYVELEDGHLHVKMGPWFDHRFSLSDLGEVAASTWPWYGGLGTKTGPEKGGVGVVGSMDGIVALRFKTPQAVKLWAVVMDVGVQCSELRVSLEEPRALIDALKGVTGPG